MFEENPQLVIELICVSRHPSRTPCSWSAYIFLAVEVVVVCPQEPSVVSCPNGSVINVTTARYGHYDSHAQCDLEDQLSSECDTDQYEYLSDLCDGLEDCTVIAENIYLADIIGDPCFGVHKFFEVTYECVGG